MDLRKFTQKLFALLFPTPCIYCGKTPFLICRQCLEQIVFVDHRECPLCRGPSLDNSPCKNCKSQTNIQTLRYIFSYSDKQRRLIRAIKYSGLFSYSFYLADTVLRWLEFHKHEFRKTDLWTFPPSSKKTIEHRGYNQVEKVLEQLSKSSLGKIKYKALFKKLKNTKRQALLTRSERLQNIAGRIQVIKKVRIPTKIERIFILDDVATTGATLSECCKVLHEKYGQKHKLHCITLARPSLFQVPHTQPYQY